MKDAFIAEVLGTALVFFLAGSASTHLLMKDGNGLPSTSLGVGFAYIGSLLFTSRISGAHLNPGITIASYFTKRLPFGVSQMFVYLAAQFIGAIIGATVLWVLLPNEYVVADAFATKVGGFFATLTGRQIFCWECATSAIVGLVTAAVSDDLFDSPTAPIAIGLTYAAGTFAIAPFTGASLNAARTLGAAIVLGEYVNLAVYLAATCIGPTLGFFAYEYYLKGHSFGQERGNNNNNNGVGLKRLNQTEYV